MAEVGVLELTIKDNASQAANGVKELAGALASVKGKSTEGLGLDNVRKELTRFTSGISAAKTTSPVFQGIAAFGKGLLDISKSVKAAQKGFDTTSIVKAITDIKDAVQEGMHLGTAGTQIKNIRDAISSEWNTENAYNAGLALAAIGEGAKSLAGASLNTRAKELSALAKSLSEFAGTGGLDAIPDAFRSAQAEQQKATAGIVDYSKAVEDFDSSIGNRKLTFKEPISEALDSINEESQAAKASISEVADVQKSAEKLFDKPYYPGRINLQFFGGRKGTTKSEGQTVMDLDGLEKQAEALQTVESTVQTATQSVKGFKTEVAETSNVINSSPFDGMLPDALTMLQERFKYAELAVEKFGNKFSAVLPKINEKSAEAVVASKNIEMLMQKLNAPINWKGLSDYVNRMTGVGRTMMDAKEFGKALANSPVASTLKEFEALEKNNAFQSWMYGPKQDIAITNNVGANTMIPDEEMMKLRPEWYQPQEYYDSLAQAAENAAPSIEKVNEALQETPNVDMQQDNSWTENILENASEIDLYNMKLDEMQTKLYEGASAGNLTASQFVDLVFQIRKTKEAIEELTNAAREQSSLGGMLSSAWGAFGNALERLFPTLSGMIKRFGQIMKYRMLRTILKQITSGISEGLENVYWYSKAVGTDFAPAMDSAASALGQMKNSIGAALVPALQSLIPVLQTVVSWFVTLVNYVNQFFALLTGQSAWTRALLTEVDAYEKKTKKAAGGAKEAKDLLADWDELNIIQSQSGGGGGGGGGSVPDYSSMFEQVSAFDEKIQRFVQFIDDHFGGIAELAKKIGIMLLGWKFSKAFSGVLGALGKIVAGGALIVIGLELAYGSGFEAGKKGYFDTWDILGAIGGSLATAIGGYLIGSAVGGPFGGVVGLAIGLGVGIVVTLFGWIDGRRDAEDLAKWGNLHYTAEQLEAYVRNQFSFDIDAEVEILDTNIQNMEAARQNANEKITQFESDLNAARINVSLGVDADPNGITVAQALASAQMALQAVQEQIDATESGIAIGLKYLPYINNEGEDVSDDYLSQIKVANVPVRQYMVDLGKDLAAAMYEGEKQKWAEGTTDMALELMKRQSEILSKSKQYAQDMKLQAGLREDMEGVVKDGVMDRESALNAMELQKQRLEDFEKTALAEIKAERDSLYDLAGLAKAEAEDALQQGEIFKGTELLASAETLKHEADERYKAAQSSIDAKLEASKKKIAQDWAELLRTVYGEDFANLADAYTKDETRSGLLWKWIADGLGMEYNSEVKNMLLEKMKSGGVEEVGKWLRDEMIVAVTNGINDPNGAVSFYMETLGGNLFDLLTDNAKQNLMNNLYKLTGDVTTASEIFQSMFNIPFGSMDPFIANIPVEVKPEVINEEELKKPALSIPGLSYKAPDEQLEVAGAVKEIAPVDATEYTESMNTVETETEDTVKKCEELYGELRQMVLSSDLSDDAKRGWLGGLADLFNKDDLSGLEKIKEYISLDNWDIAFERLQKYLSGEGWNFDMSVPPVDDTKFNSSLEAMKRAVDEAVAYIQRSLATLNGSSVGLNVNAGSYSGWSGGIRRMVPKAQGGPVKSGDLVLANENGNFEMMGKMGNQPVVANNQQIVAGISSGVAQANGRVESRLSAIENLMTRLLQKEFVAKAVPTSAWGAHNARSADAYDRVTG